MTISKIAVTIGTFTFSGEGSEEWLAIQLDKLLEKTDEFVALSGTSNSISKSISAARTNTEQTHIPADFTANSDIASKTLVSFLKEKSATSNQNLKFLATSAWLEAKGTKRLGTKDVTGALKNASQSKLGNASECLNQNVGKGFCEKDSSKFFVTQEGKQHLGIA